LITAAPCPPSCVMQRYPACSEIVSRVLAVYIGGGRLPPPGPVTQGPRPGSPSARLLRLLRSILTRPHLLDVIGFLTRKDPWVRGSCRAASENSFEGAWWAPWGFGCPPILSALRSSGPGQIITRDDALLWPSAPPAETSRACACSCPPFRTPACRRFHLEHQWHARPVWVFTPVRWLPTKGGGRGRHWKAPTASPVALANIERSCCLQDGERVDRAARPWWKTSGNGRDKSVAARLVRGRAYSES